MSPIEEHSEIEISTFGGAFLSVEAFPVIPRISFSESVDSPPNFLFLVLLYKLFYKELHIFVNRVRLISFSELVNGVSPLILVSISRI